ncbi:aminotransferase class V-fold PLP-dependent enzyme [Phycicoccus sp. CSK15P-2]|uniref:aminotransferase class V-fold PLP-dependent enzyme n=1 Tax=Phycicoccus sp. CSK15P-2 TaxID=2807627 RepID=UPI00194F2EE9|nr:aminotransferase class V-fold PLP-dependent enzyme [Phycicoccus sp. CSK15P-2]MBM6404658.1 aminotransferase class V-fold PLP-dependent enzyme [Phycicoccus sp. CSK15P-2]
MSSIRPVDESALHLAHRLTTPDVPVPAVVRPGPVPTVHGTWVDYAALDHGASTPALESVVRAVDTAVRTYSSVHRGQGWLSRVTSAHYEAAREEVARFVGARRDDVVVLTRNTTDAVTLLARALPTGTPVVVFESEHHASLLPWQPEDVHRLPVPAAGVASALTALDARLSALEDGPTPLVVVAGASNVTGELWPLDQVVRTAQRHGARVLVDAAQLVAHRPVDLGSLGADWVAFSGHKLYAPYGAGALVGRRDWLDAADPYLAGGGASAEVTRDAIRWSTGPARHEGGSPNVLGAVALAAACAAVREHRTAVEQHEHVLTERLSDGLRDIPGVRTSSIFGPDTDRGPVVAFTVDGLDAHLVAAALSAEYGIGVRAGKFCAHLLVDALLASTPEHTTAVRVSAGLATTPEHVERLLAAVRALATTGPGVEYTRDVDGGWVVADDPRDLSVELPW